MRPTETRLFDASNFIRLQVSIDTSLPLCRGHLISLHDGKEIWVSFKYERLPNICYRSSRLTHYDRDCNLWIESEGTLRIDDQKEFGPQLRAPPFTPSKRIVIKVPGYYAEKKRGSTTTTAGQASGKPPQQGRGRG